MHIYLTEIETTWLHMDTRKNRDRQTTNRNSRI